MNILPKLTLAQMMHGVFFSAVACGFVAPMYQVWRVGALAGGRPIGLLYVAIFGAIIVPLAWVLLAFLNVRPGPFRDGLITCLLLCSVSVALVFGGWSFVAYAIPAYSPGTDFASLALHGGVVLVLAAAEVFLLLRLTQRLRRSGQA